MSSHGRRGPLVPRGVLIGATAGLVLGLLVLNAAPDLLGTSGAGSSRSSAGVGSTLGSTLAPAPTASSPGTGESATAGGPGPGASPSETFTPLTPTPSVTVGGQVVAGPSSAPAADLTGSALRNLHERSRSDLARVRLRGQWVPMLASKWIGVVDPMQTTASGGHEFGAEDIWAEYTRLRDAGGSGTAPDVVLLRSTDLGNGLTVRGRPLWMTFAIGDFASRAQVRAWCQERFPGKTGAALANVCTPWRLEPPRR